MDMVRAFFRAEDDGAVGRPLVLRCDVDEVGFGGGAVAVLREERREEREEERVGRVFIGLQLFRWLVEKTAAERRSVGTSVRRRVVGGREGEAVHR